MPDKDGALCNRVKKPTKASLESIVKMRQRGLTLNEIGKVEGVTKQAIYDRLKRADIDVTAIEQFKEDKAIILHAKQKMLLDSLDKEEVKKMCPRDKVVSFGIMYDKTRLEEGKSTENVANMVKIIKQLDELDDSLDD